MHCAWFTDQGRLCFRDAPDRPNFPWPDNPRISLCGTHKAMATNWFVPADLPDIPFEESFVYFVWNRTAHQIKIGRSTDPVVRIRQLETQSGLEFDTLLVLPETSDLYEKLLHGYADAYRKQGTEWFEASPAMFAWIERLRRYGEDESALRVASIPELKEVPE